MMQYEFPDAIDGISAELATWVLTMRIAIEMRLEVVHMVIQLLGGVQRGSSMVEVDGVYITGFRVVKILYNCILASSVYMYLYNYLNLI